MIGLFQVSQGWISLDLFHQICTVSFIYNASDARIIIGPRKGRPRETRKNVRCGTFVTTSRFVTNEVVTNRAGIVPFFTCTCTCDIVCVTCVARERDNECARQTREREGAGRDTQWRTIDRRRTEKTARKRGREGDNFFRHICYKMKTLHGMKHNTQSVHVLPFISSNRTSHSVKQGHQQHTIKPHFHSVSIVIFHTAYRAGYGQQ